MKRFYSVLGAKRMKELGYSSTKNFADKLAEVIYGHLPKAESTTAQTSKQ